MVQILELFGGIGSPCCAMRNIGIPVKAIDYVDYLGKREKCIEPLYAGKFQSVFIGNGAAGV